MHDKRLIRYLGSYLVLILIPIVILGLFYSLNFTAAFREEILQNVDGDLQSFAAQIDHELSVFKSVVQQTALSAPIRSRTGQFDANSVNDIREVLFTYCSTNPFVKDIYAAFDDMGYIISTTTSISIPYFASRYYLLDGNTPAQTSDLFTSGTMRIWSVGKLHKYAQQPQDVILFVYPLYTDYLNQMGTLVFEVPYEAVSSKIDEKLELYHAQTWILDADGRIIGGFGGEEEVAGRIASIPQQSMEAVLRELQDAYIIRQYTSSQNGFQYLSLIPRNQRVFTQLTRMNLLFLLALLLVVLLSGIAVARLLRLQYFPLRRLHDRAGELVEQGGGQNMISDIENAFITLSGRNSSLVDSFEKNAGSIKNARLHTLLAGGYATLEDFNTDCQELNMHLGGERLLISTAKLHSPGASMEEIGPLFKERLSPISESYYLNTLESNRLVFVHSVSLEGYEKMPGLLMQLHDELRKNRNILLTTGVGSGVCSPRELSRSYFEASAALEYSFVKGNGKVIRYQDMEGGGNTVYPQQQFERLKNSLLSESEESVERCIDETAALIQKGNYPLAMAKGMCFSLINMAAGQPLAQGDGAAAPRFSMGEIDSVQDIAAAIKAWRRQQRGLDKRPDIKREPLRVGQVTAYLEAHCLSQDFSVNEAAEHFGMQLPKFSQYFKEQTGQSVLDYTIQLRMTEAVHLLRDTRLGLKEIAEKTGYYNTSSFIRRFKQIQGMTPGEFRKHVSGQTGGI
ncbi:MAG: helix-turn-helix transcriptional regulator [Provencibacterium sp.]|jgi:two-component system response regulator YesN|nr:helix-turn-helix transcriptional regulator [Provencibacterium sp.]